MQPSLMNNAVEKLSSTKKIESASPSKSIALTKWVYSTPSTITKIVSVHFSEKETTLRMDFWRPQDVDANVLGDPSCRVCANNAVQSDHEVLEQSYSSSKCKWKPNFADVISLAWQQRFVRYNRQVSLNMGTSMVLSINVSLFITIEMKTLLAVALPHLLLWP